MPKKFERCVKKLKEEGASDDKAYGVCTNAWKKTHGGKAPKLHHKTKQKKG